MTGDEDDLLNQDWSSAWRSLREPPRLVPRRKTAQITLRLPTSLLARIKRVAAAHSLPYHALARSWIQEAVRDSAIPPIARSDEPNIQQLNLKLTQELLDQVKERAHQVRRPYHGIARGWLEAAVTRHEMRLGLRPLGNEHEALLFGAHTRSDANIVNFPPETLQPRLDEIFELDDLSETEFDRAIAELLEARGYSNVRTTPDSEGFGADILADRHGLTYAVHTQQSLHAIAVTAVRQAVGGMTYSAADRALVVTNSFFAQSAREAADIAGVELVDRSELRRWLAQGRLSSAARPVIPRAHQLQALTNLRRLREEHERRALIVMAAGLGKTYVAAFDVQQYEHAVGRSARVLYLSHQAVILQQARHSFERVFGLARTYGDFVADRRELDADFLFASFQSLHQNLERVAPEAFDYVIVDEAHHTAAPTRDAVVRHLAPGFLLGLTATPFRADGKDISTYYGDVLASSIPLERALAHGLLTPIDYRVVSDTVDRAALADTLRGRDGAGNGNVFRPLPDEAIVNTVMSEAAVIDGKRRVLVFCATLGQMDHFAKAFPNSRTISGRDSRGEQIAAVEDLRAGAIEILLSRDVLNEGVDIPHAATLVFLRNTESPTVFLQQLGRGLRRAEGKERVDVFDFVNTLARVELVYQFFSRLESEQAARRARGELSASGASALVLDSAARDVVAGLLHRKQRSGRVADLNSMSAAFDYKVSVATLRRIVESGRLLPDFVMPTPEPRAKMYFESPTVERFMRQVHSRQYTAGLLSALEFARRIEKPVSWVRDQQRRGTLAASWMHRRPNGTLEPYFEPDDVDRFGRRGE